MSELRFDGRVAVVTGGGRGLGRSHALLLGSRGAKVVVNDPGGSIVGEGGDASPAEDVAAEIRAAGGEAVANLDSVATPEGGQAIVQSAIDHFGRIDIIVHNAGNVRRGSLKEISYEDFEAVLDVHLRGAFHVVRPAFPLMAAQRYGRVVLTSSIGGLYGNYNVVNYSVAKAGMIGLNRMIALEGAEVGIKSNLLVPGAVTRMAEGLDISQYPPMDPELVSPTVGFLSHEDCPVSGEMYASIAGRVARCYIGEAPGVYRSSWTIEQVAGDFDQIRDISDPVVFGLDGFAKHIGYSFGMAKAQGTTAQ